MSSYHYFGNKGERIPDDVEELVVHPLIHEIPAHACSNFEQLSRVHFNGTSLRAIEECAFDGCVSLLEIEIPPSVAVIGDSAFMECEALTRVRFHEDGLLTTIGNWAFQKCSSLAEVSILCSVETIQKGTFSYCELLARVFFQEGLKTIDRDVFASCVQLETVDIPRSLELLGSGAFYRCTSLQEVNFDEENLRVIGKHAFMQCFKSCKQSTFLPLLSVLNRTHSATAIL
ncbi:unnamed protein product [Cylindrotheca closterium]|uniref:Leucine-rich repeat domain-containing protein n=1 Tax=Cylindrotheca closterium TaxID=2856 RepID=A0AAD2G5U4_9STRA|nr:unnamed protein product [Cylindrotheca closterium]